MREKHSAAYRVYVWLSAAGYGDSEIEEVLDTAEWHGWASPALDAKLLELSERLAHRGVELSIPPVNPS